MHCSFYLTPLLSHTSSDLLQFIREVYWDYEYEEVVTPNIYNFDLWKTSGHAEHYKQNMFSFDIEKQEFGLKPMNCPGPSPAQCCLFSLPCFVSLKRATFLPGLGAHIFCRGIHCASVSWRVLSSAQCTSCRAFATTRLGLTFSLTESQDTPLLKELD